MSAGSFHESDLAQAISQIKVSNIFGYRDLLAYVSSLGVLIVEPEQYARLTYVGSGSYSIVYRTNNITTGNTVAFKTPGSSLSRADARLEDEAYHRALSSIIQELRILAHRGLATHPNLPRVIGVCFRQDSHQNEASPGILQEYAFCDLRHYLMSVDSIPVTEKARLALDVARGICALHSYRLVHGDIHPKNILLFRRDNSLIAAVGDLGTCDVESSSAFIPGTKPFWAPECHPRSQFHMDHANSSARDVYAFGLLLNSMIASSYTDELFPPDQQFDIQHRQNKTIQHLEQKDGADHILDKLIDVVLLAVKVEPRERADIATICRNLESICGEERPLQDITDIAQTELLKDPSAPRTREINEMPLPSSVISRITAEYRVAGRETNDARVALAMAALYAGVIGPGLEGPWKDVAKTQWLFKALELGFYPSLTTIVTDKSVMRLVEDFGQKILGIGNHSFESPKINETTLMNWLGSFAAMPDTGALKVLESLGGHISNNAESQVLLLRREQDSQRTELRRTMPGVFQFEKFTLNRTIDAGPIDSDASDLKILTTGTPLEKFAYSNSLERFVNALVERELTPREGDNYMQKAIYGGAHGVAQYLLHRHGIRSEREVDGMSHMDTSILFKRTRIVETFLQAGGTVLPAREDQPSGLHLASRHDDRELILMLCGHLQEKGSLKSVLESKCTRGKMASWTPLMTAMICHCYINVMVFLDFGADPNAEDGDGQRLIHHFVQPSSPSPPTSVLVRLVEAGADVNWTTLKFDPPLHTAIGSTNVRAVYHLLLAGANAEIVSNAGDTPLESATGNFQSMQEEEPVNTLDEDGKLCEGGYDDCKVATRVIMEMIHEAVARSSGWQERLNKLLETTKPSLLDKIWIPDRIPITYFLQIAVPS